tara:strand:- start:5568 stop:6002 length:435 start_codon:yes stop_codon:yes gene_type:complete
MAKKKRQQYFSFIEDGVRYMECSVCGKSVRNVSESAISILCASCLMPRLFARWNPMVQNQYIKTGRPPGWQWMKEFVDSDGNVFHKGKEIPDLKGTLSPTKVKKKIKKKTHKVKKSFEAEINSLAREYKKKQKLKRKTQRDINK